MTKKNFNSFFIDIYSYSSFVIGNLLLIIFLPSEISKNFLQNYSLAMGISGFFIFLLFSSWQNYLSKFNFFILIIFFLLFFFKENLIFLFSVYAVSVIYFDYISTQSFDKKKTLILRTFVLITGTLFAFDFLSFFKIIEIRLLFFFAVFIFFYFNFKKTKILKVKNIFNYIFLTHIGYYVPLFFLTFFLQNFELKIWYIFTQISFSLLLKVFDFRIRYLDIMNKSYLGYLTNLCFLFPLVIFPLMYFYYSIMGLLCFVTGFVILYFAYKFCIK